MRNAHLLLALACSTLAGLACAAGPGAVPPETPPAEIHFADLGGIRNWRAIGDDALLVQGTNGQWFRADFFGSCFGLRSAESIGFVTEPGGSLDRFSSVVVRDQRCYFRSFVPTAPPGERETPEQP